MSPCPHSRVRTRQSDLLDLLNVLGRLVKLEPAQADLLERICAGPLLSVETLRTAGAIVPGPGRGRLIAVDNAGAPLAGASAPRHAARRKDRDIAAMSRRDQPDLFGAVQPDMFGAEAAPISYRADPDRVRARLQTIIGLARSADTLPWNRAELRLYRTIVPQMTLWLPEDEAARWRLDFEAELERLQAA